MGSHGQDERALSRAGAAVPADDGERANPQGPPPLGDGKGGGALSGGGDPGRGRKRLHAGAGRAKARARRDISPRLQPRRPVLARAGAGPLPRFLPSIPPPKAASTRDIGPLALIGLPSRSEERRVGKECRSRWSPYH